jgi:hypothetical protein
MSENGLYLTDMTTRRGVQMTPIPRSHVVTIRVGQSLTLSGRRDGEAQGSGVVFTVVRCVRQPRVCAAHGLITGQRTSTCHRGLQLAF